MGGGGDTVYRFYVHLAWEVREEAVIQYGLVLCVFNGGLRVEAVMQYTGFMRI